MGPWSTSPSRSGVSSSAHRTRARASGAPTVQCSADGDRCENEAKGTPLRQWTRVAGLALAAALGAESVRQGGSEGNEELWEVSLQFDTEPYAYQLVR